MNIFDFINFEFLKFVEVHKDAITIIIASIVAVVTVGAFIKAVCEYRLQGRQKREEFFNKLNETFNGLEFKIITSMLEYDDDELKNITEVDKYDFLGFYEQIAIAVNSKLIKKNIAHYFFGYFAIKCWNSKNFWHVNNKNEIDKNDYYWVIFNKFVYEMRKIENRRLNPKKYQRWLDKVFYRRLYGF
ncbi:MAG: hypothetical protein ABR974_00995 [Bacteroidales bacterium]|jgi:hypothetical protein